MAGSKGSKSTKAQTQPAEAQGDIYIGGNVAGDHIVIGHNNVIIIDGKQVQFRTGWFFGHCYGDLATFTGREAELKTLNEWLSNDKEVLLMLRALGGFGKSALAWTWFNSVHREQWQTAVWWSFYEKESGFESFLSETLKHLGVEVKESARQQVNDLLEAMRGTNILIVLDGFERLLRQYGRMDAVLQSDDEDADIDPSQRDCSSPLTETFLRGLSGVGMKSKVLMTTRLCPRVLESADGKLLKGCRDEALSAFSPEDAVTYFHNEGIKATRAEIIEVCSAYGYHPLSLSLLVGLINEDHEHRGDIAAVKNLEIFEDVRARRHHVLERAYASLAPERRDLLSKISCFRGSMEYAVLKKVFPSPDLDKALLDLRKRGLLQYAGETGRYDLHPIVRHYAYDHFTDNDRKDAHERLVNYFEAIPKPEKVNALEDLAPLIELYYHMVMTEKFNGAWILFRDHILRSLYYQLGGYQMQISLLTSLFNDKKITTSKLDEIYQAHCLVEIANAYSVTGQPLNAIPLVETSVTIFEKIGDLKKLSVSLGNVALDQTKVGSFIKAGYNLQRSINICHEMKNKTWEAVFHTYLAPLSIYRGAWDDAKENLDLALELFDDPENDVRSHWAGLVFSYYTLRLLNMFRLDGKETIVIEMMDNVNQAIKHMEEFSRTKYPIEREYIRNYWLLGVVCQTQNNAEEAAKYLKESLSRCRKINMVDIEANILLALAKLRFAQGDFQGAQEKASEALMITERSGYVLQGADVNLFLAQYALEQEKDKVKAKEYAEEAKKLATCDGPPYYYKVAYEEAERMLEKLGKS